MPRTTCCVPGCCKRGGFFFPVNSELRRLWLDAIQRSNWEPKDNSTVCKDHFNKHDFMHEGGVPIDKLKKTVVPSVFWWTNDNQDDKPVGVRKITDSPAKSSTKGNQATEYDSGEDDIEEDEFIDDGAQLKDSDEEFNINEELGQEPEESDEEIEEEAEKIERVVPTPKQSKLKKTPKNTAPKGIPRKHKIETDDILLNTSKRPKIESMTEYSKQLNKAYHEISRLSARNQVLDAALKNKSMVTHRSRTLYQIGKYVMPHQLSFIEAQAVNSNLPPSMRRWSRRMRNICLGLYRHSKQAYGFMSKIFALPTEEELIKWGVQTNDLKSSDNISTNNLPLVEADALVDEVTFDNLMTIVL